LLYHSVNDSPPSGQELFTVSPRSFAAHIAAIADLGFTTVALGVVARYLRAGSPLPSDTVAVSFDDGYADLLDNALPVLSECGFGATLFQTTGVIGGVFSDATMLDARGICELSASGMEIGSHTISHPHLDLVPDDVLRRELVESKDQLEQILGRPVDAVAYPHGSFRTNVVGGAGRAGYTWGAAVKNAYTHAGDDPWAIARITVTAKHSGSDIARILAGSAAPMAWPRERLRTTAFRQLRRMRTDGGHDRGRR
jgi:peptidoglycan/xylan/chitin deacetylase (PgdA/CDA1 family)